MKKKNLVLERETLRTLNLRLVVGGFATLRCTDTKPTGADSCLCTAYTLRTCY